MPDPCRSPLCRAVLQAAESAPLNPEDWGGTLSEVWPHLLTHTRQAVTDLERAGYLRVHYRRWWITEAGRKRLGRG